MSQPTERPRRGDKRERTQAALIAATWAIIEEHGVAGASLDRIARRAGMTRGAIYSNFATRADLLLTAAGVRGLKIDRDFSGPATVREKLRRFAEGLIETLPNAPGTQQWHAEFMLHIATDAEMKARVATGYAEGFQHMAAGLATGAGDTLAIAPHSLALAVQAMAMGFVYQAILSPEVVQPQTVLEAFDALALGASGHRPDEPRG